MLNPKLKLYFCTLDTSVAYYLVAAEIASDCFDVIDQTEQIRAIGAYPSALKIELADELHLTEHRMRDTHGKPIGLSTIQFVGLPGVLWSSDWATW